MVWPAKFARCSCLGSSSIRRLSISDLVVLVLILCLRAQADGVPSGTGGAPKRMACQLPRLGCLQGEDPRPFWLMLSMDSFSSQ